jgi:tRNA/rRNA methyltransferase
MISVIFVDPESPGNVGSISRCMKNFGADQLLLVNPCPLAGARKMAMHAVDILETAVTVDSLPEALALVDTSIATTSRVSKLARKAITPHELNSVSGHIGIVIGRESHGLTTEEIELCDFVVSIPTSRAYPVLNAASTCCILLYELFTREEEEGKPGTRAQRERLLKECERISNLMEKRPHRKKIWKIAMRRVFSKAFLTDREATILLGFFRRIRTVLELTLSQKR